jgi:hypothetical protein
MSSEGCSRLRVIQCGMSLVLRDRISEGKQSVSVDCHSLLYGNQTATSSCQIKWRERSPNSSWIAKPGRVGNPLAARCATTANSRIQKLLSADVRHRL